MSGAVLELFAKLGLDSSEYDKGLGDAKDKGSKFASFLGNVGKVGAAAFTAVGTATVAVGKQAVEAYANYEQLWGGVQKLYGDAAETVRQNAEQAFMTSGMDMNKYMETATGISAALIKSLNGDTQKAADVTDIAMRAMSDNVNTFGTDAEAVSNAFMGLSRNNYTMIDNLKLGYAGTAQGMLELINDSGVLGKKLTNTSQLAKVGFADMVLAIQKVQEQQNIAGTTAKEAMSTIEGSAKATKAAWQNVITAIGKGEGLEDALGGLSSAIFGENEGEGLLANIIPRIQTTMESIGDFVVNAAPLIAEKIPSILDSVLPSVLETTSQVIMSLVNYIISNIPNVISTGISLLGGLAQGIRENLPTIIATATEVITDFLGEIIYELPDIIAAGINIVMGLVEGIVTSIPTVLDGIGELLDKAWHAITEFDWISVGKNIIDGIVKGIKNFGSAIGETLIDFASNSFSGLKKFFKIGSPSKLMRDEIGKWIPEGIAEGIKMNEGSVFDAMSEMPDMVSRGFNSGSFNFENPIQEQKSDNLGTVIALLEQIANGGMNVTLEGDANQLFKVVRKQSINFERAKGYSAI